LGGEKKCAERNLRRRLFQSEPYTEVSDEHMTLRSQIIE
jgi:hypothetical protein